ncbi:Murein DD-endopeptidase MepM and murein hydrolase activator NlpD, contain LysM domain [Jannaschia faecimaris]|uniref:Murein DD-endopeptidase MepM and murein hydrolase activator NlpD, contain LysM domain n=1 Tax=Jannaschia faecimaris TaxID=1244108 RepID=A0A1H3SKC9_9RHOB|nr:peptidoglycan DD-metalloendopeptidase family protein [Jannaschia faecimaris]SDZ38523.1 Murein DD-endopeptidase MepM and murein hydrolase activator NlpD, contain LysM domain [Jannaschia faecimaris]
MSITGKTAWIGLMTSVGILAGCSEFQSGNLDFDLRNNAGTIDTTEGVRLTPAARPMPDANGLITYSTYQVAVARRGDTVQTVADRIGYSSIELARFNGVSPDTRLNKDAVLALPGRIVPEAATNGARPDISSIAGAAIDRASGGTSPQVTVQGGQEPVRHRVARGETAFSIARLYGVSPSALAEWNGLGPDLAVREGQYLLIPLVVSEDGALEIATPAPGVGTATPVPPSASSALPEAVEAEPLPDGPQLDQFRTAASAPAPAREPVSTSAPEPEATLSRLRRPVAGEVLRPFSGRNEGIDFRASEGTAVQAAATGTVAAITRDTDQVPILVLRHEGGLLTVYANIKDIRVAKGDSIAAGQRVASVGGGDPAFLHFEVRRGFDAIDPAPLLR